VNRILGGLIALVATAALAAVLIPKILLGKVAIAAIGLLGVSVAAWLWLPLMLNSAIGVARNDAGWLTSLGPRSALLALLSLVAMSSLWAALESARVLSIALDIVWCAAAALGFLGTVSASQFNAKADTARDSRGDRNRWIEQLRTAAAAGSTGEAAILNKLAEAIRYAATDLPGMPSTVNARISDEVDRIARSMRDPARNLAEASARIEQLLVERESALRNGRSRA